jgi:hypothetical protein
MSREAHVRIGGSRRVRFPPATRPPGWRGLFLLDSEFAASPELDAWLAASRPQVLSTVQGQ